MPRFFVDHDFVAGLAMPLPATVARHVQVLRLQPGAAVTLFNGRDGAEWRASVLRMGKSEVEVQLESAAAIDRELPWQVTLAIGAPANDRMDALVEKAGELGAAGIQPLICERSVLRLVGDRAEAKRRHWQGVATAASEQCGRVGVTAVAAMRPLASWLHEAGLGEDPGGAVALRIVLSFDARALPLADVIGGPETTALRRLVVLSGPEGGLAPGEEDAAVTCGFVRTGLGPRVLRADTAPLAVLAWLGQQPTPAGS